MSPRIFEHLCQQLKVPTAPCAVISVHRPIAEELQRNLRYPPESSAATLTSAALGSDLAFRADLGQMPAMALALREAHHPDHQAPATTNALRPSTAGTPGGRPGTDVNAVDSPAGFFLST